MKTRLIPVLMTAVLAAIAAQARSNDDDGDRPQQRGRPPHMAAPQQQQQPQQQPQRQAQPQQQTQPQPQPSQPQGEPRERERSGAGAGAVPPRGWIPGDPNHPSAPRGNPYAGNPGPRGGARPMPSPPAASGNGAQGSGQRAGQQADDPSRRGNRPQYSNQNPNWQADRSRAPNGPRPQDANQPRNWRDSPGHDWRANRGWYDRYRVDHFRFNGGRYFARQRYSGGGYTWPRGYSTRLWLTGEWLPSVFFIDGRYDLNDYWSYDLYEPPLGCRWTRVSNDALLIDEVTGEVLDVVYDLFW
jgi:Ni/Co efflux regulator RcnB